MKVLIATLTLVLFSQLLPAQESDDSYKQLWARVHKLERESMTKSALEVVQNISVKAKKEKNSSQIVKSLLFTSKYALILEEDAQLKIVSDLKNEITAAEFPVTNILESYLANLYWQYFQQNRYQFYNRTATEAKVDTVDFRTWDLTTLFHEINYHFEKSLDNPEGLQKESLKDFHDIIDSQEDSAIYRPTLFDLLAHTALQFYKTDETSITRPAEKFEIDEPQYLCEAYAFTQLNLPNSDETSLQARALTLYQQLVSFHFSNPDLRPLVEVDIERLNYTHSKAVLPDKDNILLEVLKESAENLKQHESSALYRYETASLLRTQGNNYRPEKGNEHRWKLKEAIAVCDLVYAEFPNSRGAEKCKVLKSQILAPTLNITAEKHIPINQASRLLVNYKNHEALELKAYKVSQKQLEELENLYPIQKRLSYILGLKLQTSWTVKLKNEDDYQLHSIEIPAPALANGQYIILATPAAPKQEKDSTESFAYSPIQVTNLVLMETRMPAKHIFQVVDRNTGKPKPNAKITLYYKKNYRGMLLTKNLVTDKMGFASMDLTQKSISVQKCKVYNEDDVAFFGNTYINQKKRENKMPKITYKTFLFKDRSIYRPGQSLYFKGILIENDNGLSTVASKESVTVGLYDVNGQKISEMDLETNEFGSFTGEFLVPSSGITGQHYLEVYGLSGLVNEDFYFSVEEYKRPKFETSFNAIKETFKVNDSVTVKGTATAFAGSSISQAKVTYRVQRNVNFPPWYYWRTSYYYNEPQEIAHGETLTNDKGDYEISFKAIPDLSVDKDDLPIFSYSVTADVTDINGETRSTSTTVRVGYHAMTANIIVDDKLDKSAKDQIIRISTQNLNGQDVSAKGVLKIYKLESPEYVLRIRPWPSPDYQYWSKKDFKALYPHDAYTTEHDPNTWEKGKLVMETNFDTSKSTDIALRNIKKWDSGKYLLEMETTDAFGQKVRARSRTDVYTDNERKLADNQLFDVKTDKPSYEVGDVAEVTFYSNAEKVFITINVEKDKEIIRTEILELNDGCESISIPVSKMDEGGFGVHYSYSVYNAYQSGSVNISVPYPKTDLEIERLTFRDKLQPGTDETWSFKVKGPKGDKVTAEVLASMYDASLDQFVGHGWYFNPISRPYYYSSLYTSANQSFGTTSFRNFNAYQIVSGVPSINFDHLEWFGLSFSNPYYAQQNYLRRLRSSTQNSARTDASIKEGFVKGTVYDEFGQPLPGVNVVISGTSKGTQTDFDGNFTLEAKQGVSLIFTYIGYETYRQKIEKHNYFEIYLQADFSALEEVVVTGYGVQKRTQRTAAVAMVADEEMEMEADVTNVLQGKVAGMSVDEAPAPETSISPNPIDFSTVQIRKNLQETAFFFPKLLTDSEGNVSFTFTTPEALTRWNLQLLAHTKDLKQSTTTLSTITQKELMVLPNPPRFLREGDAITISGKISNLSDNALDGFGQLELTDVISGKNIDSLLHNAEKTQEFSVDAKENTQLSWNINIPKGIQAVQYKIVAKAGDFSDGEQSVLPVLTNRMLVTETMPMWVRSNQSKTFVLEKLKDNTSTTLSNHKLTLEITSNPAWYAVQALPYLMEYPYECIEQTFSRYYANALASHIANSNPRIRSVFDQWANSAAMTGSGTALQSNLEKNQELKSLLIQETPWLRDAQSETEQKKRIALLFDLNKMQNEKDMALQKLKSNQMASGAWPWFKGGRENRYITQHIISGLGHLQKLTSATLGNQNAALQEKAVSGTERSRSPEKQLIKNALEYLDHEFVREYEQMKKYATDLSKDHLSYTQIHYLYMRSFFKDFESSKKVDEVIDYYKDQAKKYWTTKNLFSKGMLALVLQRMEDGATANKIIRSLKENSIVSEELGMYWKENTSSWYWHQAPIETQALLIEAFSEIENDETTIDNLKVWLLKNKQTNQWKTTKATTEAVYALLLKGSDWLSVTDAIDVLVGGEKIAPKKLENVKVEVGTGYFKTAWNTQEIEPEMAKVQLSKKGEGIAWGALYWQYFEDLDKITFADTPLQLKKKLFLKKNTDTGEKISEITAETDLKVGDLVRVRIELKSDRDMEFIHMKDMRAAGFEPVNVLSQYKWQDGLGYYESTKDASTNFFFDYLPKGVYVFEYDVRVNNAGDFSIGITTIQSMYAPEFSSHSEGIRVVVKAP
ncbi:alpha-2-macroglobulin family protein [Maribacter aestuarii]|uniref:alpha-2-macroglobulin family protein n=1 Tax=Maribacter aestuarii TaxID=1130723 RepID=UPI0025A54698|nr:carboxypeptidase-like regulatory domain-containing protein [Maribacter aestuarii]